MTSKRMMGIYYRCPKSIQTLGINLVETREWLINHSGQVDRYLDLLRQSQSWSNERFTKYQNTRLRDIVRFAYQEVPFYRRLYKEHDIDISSIRAVKDLEKLPIVSKTTVKKYNDDFYPRRWTRARTLYTSGTTGSPLKVMVSSDCMAMARACALLRNSWAGHDDELIARFVGDKPVFDCADRYLYRYSYVMRRLLFPSYCISIQTFEKIFDVLKRHEVRYLQCYPSTAYILSKLLESHDIFYPLKAMLYSSEPMYPFQRKIIEERFQTQAFGFYSQIETVLSASECEHCRYHLAMLDGVLEVLRDEQGAAPGERGLAVVTTLINRSMPLIRYHLDDYTGYIEDDCECGRRSPTIFPVEARSGDLIVTPGGMIISPRSLSSPLQHLQHIVETQIVQRTIEQITVRIVPSEGFSDLDEKALLDTYSKILGADVSLRVEKVDKIYQSSSYKKRFVISELTGDLIERARAECESG